MGERMIRMVCSAYGKLLGEKALYSHETEGNFTSMGIADKLWWGYKHYIRQVERAQKGTSIEQHFANQKLCFNLPEDYSEETNITLTAGGDIMSNPFLTPKSTEHAFDEIEEFFFEADITYANMEAPITISDVSFKPPHHNATPAMCNSEAMLQSLHRNGKGIMLFSTANNHCLDLGIDGLVETLNILERNKCDHVGIARSKDELEKIKVIEKNGIRIAFFSYTFSVNGKEVNTDSVHLANYIRLNLEDADLSLIKKQVEKAKNEENADFVVLLPHWSLEYELYPVETVMNTARKLAALGADVIIGNHPHCVQPIERLKVADPFTGGEKECLVVYALGNLLGDASRRGNWNLAYLLKLHISKGRKNNKSAVVISGMSILPFYSMAKVKDGHYLEHSLLDMKKLANELREEINTYAVNEEEITEIYRLEKIMYQVLEPAINQK